MERWNEVSSMMEEFAELPEGGGHLDPFELTEGYHGEIVVSSFVIKNHKKYTKSS